MSNLHCSGCRKNLPSAQFVRNEHANLYFKTCFLCRSKRSHQRQNLQRQRSVNPLETESLVNNTNTEGLFILY